MAASELVEYHFEKYAHQICFTVIPALHAVRSNRQTISKNVFTVVHHIVPGKPPLRSDHQINSQPNLRDGIKS